MLDQLKCHRKLKMKPRAKRVAFFTKFMYPRPTMKKCTCRNTFHLVWIFFLTLFVDVLCPAQTSNISGTINIYTPVTALDTSMCPSKLVVGSSSGFSVGDSVLIIQMKGADFDSSNTSTFGNLNLLKGAGNYEISKITAVNSNTISLNGKLVNPYAVSGFVQLVRIPSYINAIVTSSLSCPPWNGSTGGVLILSVQSLLQLNANIDVSGKGFRGGTISNNPDGSCGSGSPLYFYPLTQGGVAWASGGAQKGEGIASISSGKQAGRGALVNGGGGGNKHNTGGGGGSNFTAGGKGGDGLSGCNHTTGGLGGKDLSSYYLMNKLFLGGGGGCGDMNNNIGTVGEHGGGIVIITSGTIAGNGFAILANGNSVTGVGGSFADGAGGGGGGGVVFLKSGPIISTLSAQASGGNGGNQNPSGYCVGPGGGGGSGIILTSLATLSGNSLSLTPGNAGIHIAGTCINSPFGATAGSLNLAGSLTGKNLVYTPSTNPNLSITAVSSQSVICSGNSVSLTAGGATSYTWLPINLTGSMVVVSPGTSNVYTVIGATLSGCPNTASLSQIVNPTPTLLTSASSTFICSGQSITLSASGANTYTWQPGALSGSVQVVSPLFTGTYTLTAHNTFSCSASALISLSVNPTPTLNVSVSNSFVCPGEVVQLSVNGAISYTWNNGSNSNSFTMVPTPPSVHSVTGTSNGCSSSGSLSILAKPVPNISFNTFSITCASLGSATAVVSGGTGPFTFTWTPTNQNTAIASGLFPGTYTLQVYDQGTGCSFAPSTTFFPLVPLTATVVASSSLSCHGIPTGTALAILAGGSGTQSYTWTNANGIQHTATVSSLAAGISTLNVIDGLTFCSVTQTFLITQPPALSLTISASSPSVCVGGSIQFTASMSGGIAPYTYTWLPSQISQTLSVQNPNPGAYQFTVISRDANQCLHSQNTNVAFVANPTVVASSASICPLQTATLFATGASSYTWSTGTGGNSLTTSPVSSSSYSVIGSLQSCTASAVSTVMVLPTPTALASNSGTVCTGQSLFLFGSGGTPLWSGPLGFTSTNSNPTLLTVNAANSGYYVLKVTAPNGCTASAVTQATVLPPPFLSALGSTVCEGQNAALHSYFTAGNQFLWQGPNSFSSNVQFPTLLNASVANNGNYTLTATAANGCTNSAVAQISVTSLPFFNVQNNSPVCEQQTLQLSASPPVFSYTWHTPNSGSSVSSGLTFNTALPQHSGTYTVLTTFGPCTSTSLIPVVIHPLPSLSISILSPVCETNTTVISVIGGSSFTWSGPGGFSNSQSSFTLSPLQLSNAGIYTVVVSDGNSCTNTAYDTLFVLPNPTPVVMGSSVCIGNTATLNVSGGQSYIWFGPMGFTSTLSTISLFVPSLSYAGQYTVVTSAANSCTVLSLLNLDAFPYALPLIQITGTPTVCLNSTLSLNASGGNTYMWTGPNFYASHQQQMTLYANSLQYAGVYTLSVLNSSQCISSTTLEIEIFELPMADLTTPISFGCEPLCCKFELKPAGASAGFVDAGFYINGETLAGSSAEFCFLNAGTHQIEAYYTDSNSCMNRASLNVSVFPKPIAEFRYSPFEPKAGVDEVVFNNASLGDEQNTWTWFFMSPYSDTIAAVATSKLFELAGNYPVALLVTNTWGCIDTVVKIIQVEDDYSIYVPNSFTPNNDGLNDIFQAKGTGFTDYTLEVYDRWGEVIFTSHNFQTGWDGNYKEQGPKCDVYVWKIGLKTLSGKTKTLTGQVSLIR